MQVIKSFDVFQKTSVEAAPKSTLSGAILSVVAISIMLYLLIKEITHQIYPNIEKQTIVTNLPQLTQVNINIKVRVFNSPCSILSVDQEDQTGHHRANIRNTLKHTRISKNGELQPEIDQFDVKTLAKAIDNGEGCLVDGYVVLTKVPGDVHLSYHSSRNLYGLLQAQHPQSFAKLNVNHHFEEISFTNDLGLSKEILNRFNIKDKSSFTRENMPLMDKEKDPQDYEYYLKVIPYWFHDENTDENFFGYQYSFTHAKKKIDAIVEMPRVMLNYDFLPITMKMTIKRRSFLKFSTHVCAIVGGVFVIFSLLAKFLNSILME